MAGAVNIRNRPSISQELSLAELWDYTGPDGALYRINGKVDRRVLSANGLGMPGIEYITDRAPFQHGQTVLDYFLQPRIIQLGVRQMSSTRTGYWDQRSALINGIRPNRDPGGGLLTGTLRFTMPNGSRRSIQCLIQDTPTFPMEHRGWDEFGFTDVLRFLCFNPVWYDPDSETGTLVECGGGSVFPLPVPFTLGASCGLIFPITFPITFGAAYRVADIQYDGNWLEYPIIVIEGPMSSATITNVDTGETITLLRSLLTGEYVTIDLSFAAKTVVLTSGGVDTNIIGSITAASDLATWHLGPDPEVVDGLNHISVNMQGSGASSQVTITWLNRYLAI